MLNTWFFITADHYEFGASLQAGGITEEEFVKAAGGEVLGSTRAPLGTADFSSHLLQAWAKYRARRRDRPRANAGTDLQNWLHQAGGRVRRSPRAVQSAGWLALLMIINDVLSTGVQVTCARGPGADQFVLLGLVTGNARVDGPLRGEDADAAERV